jgi:hypothetical protein
LDVLGECQELLAQGVCRLVLGADIIIMPQSTHHGEKLVRIVQGVAELLRSEIGLSDFRSGEALGGNQGCPEGSMHIYFALDALKGLGQCLEQLQPLTQVSDSFHMC